MDTIYKIYQVKKALSEVHRAKVNAQRERVGLPPIMPWHEHAWSAFMTSMRASIRVTCCPGCTFERRKAYRPSFCKSGTISNEAMKSVLGFICGVLLSLATFHILANFLHYPAFVCGVTCIIIGSVLCMGLAFSSYVRCITLLILPVLCSNKGRAVLLTYCFVLIMTHPMPNFSKNVIIFTDSFLCGQRELLKATKNLVDQALAPAKAMIGKIRSLIKNLGHFVNKVKIAFTRVKRVFDSLFSAIGRVLSWLTNMVKECNRRIATPYNNCRRGIQAGVEDCWAKLKILWRICGLADVRWVCEIVKVAELLCIITSWITSVVQTLIVTPIKGVIGEIENMFYFKVIVDYHYNITLEQSRTFAEIKGDIMTEIQQRLSFLSVLLNWGNWALLLTFVYMIFSATVYRMKFLSRDHFDNYYITHNIRRLDDYREEMGKEFVFPLSSREKNHFITTTSLTMVRSELYDLLAGLIFFGASALHCAFYVCIDYGLFVLLRTINSIGQVLSDYETPSSVAMHVDGKGMLPNVYRALVTQFDPQNETKITNEVVECLPKPSRPNFQIYKQIGNLLLVALWTVLFEAYIRRTRHVVCSYFYPIREKSRAVWLYNHIRKRRENFLLYYRRQARLEQEKQKASADIDLITKIFATIPCDIGLHILRMIGHQQLYCLACGVVGELDDAGNFVACANRGCRGVYCKECKDNLGNICTMCTNPIDYGDVSDVNEEVDSSAEEEPEDRKVVTPQLYDKLQKFGIDPNDPNMKGQIVKSNSRKRSVKDLDLATVADLADVEESDEEEDYKEYKKASTRLWKRKNRGDVEKGRASIKSKK